MDITIFPIITESESRLPFYVKSVGVRDNQEHVIRPSGYPDYHYIHCASGSGKLLVDGMEHMIRQNMGFFLLPGIPHEYFSIDCPWKTYWVTFDGYAVKEMLSMLKFDKWTVFHLAGRSILEKHLEDICKVSASHSHLNLHQTSVLLYSFLIELKEHICEGPSQLKPSHIEQILPVVQYIDSHYNNSISLTEMASVIRVTPQHLCRLFKQTYNMRPFEFLTHYRLKKAKELLTSQQYHSVKEIALSVGYNDTSYFCSTFKEYEGCTPLEFKMIYGA